MPEIVRRLSTSDPDFDAALTALTAWDVSEEDAVTRAARDIIAAVRTRGDEALLEYTRRFDRLTCASVAELELGPDELAACLHALPELERAALQEAAQRIRAFHEAQRQDSFEITDALGNRLGNRVTPIDRVGVYVPGGQAAYPSTVLMTAIPAAVAGVREIVVTVPTPDGVRNPLVLAAMHIAGVSSVFCVGGAQAIAALAFGTQDDPARRQDRWAGRRVRRRREATRVRSRRNRRDCRPERDSRDIGWFGRRRLDCARSVLAGRARCRGASDPAHAERRTSGGGARVDAAVAAEPAAPRHDRAIVASTRSVDSHARSRRGRRDRESHRAGASRAGGRGSGRVVADDSTCRRDLRRRVHQ